RHASRNGCVCSGSQWATRLGWNYSTWWRTSQPVLLRSTDPGAGYARTRIARGDALEIADTLEAPLSLEGKKCPLRVAHLHDPSRARHLDGGVQDRPPVGLHALHRVVDVGHVEVIEPERIGERCRLVEHAADRAAAGSERLVRAHRA